MRLSERTVLEAVLGPIRKTQGGQILLQLYRARRDPKFASLLRRGTREERFSYIYESQSWGPGGESRSGYGSSMRATSTLRQQLSRLLAELQITSIFDAGCGDFNWMKEVPYSGTYIGVDIVPNLIDRLNEQYGNESHRFVSMDIAEHPPPTVDLIICRRVLFHLPDADVAAALRNFRASGSRWLLVTTDTNARRNWDIEVGGQRRLNLERPPFSLPRPERYLIDGRPSDGEWRSDGECMSLYRLQRLPNL